MSRYTLKREISFRGVGLHSGTPVSMRLLPAGSGEGYVFLFGGKRFPIQAAKHSGDGRGTILAFDSNRVMTVEHVLGALRGLGVDDVILCPEGIETPLLDGSAAPFCEEILKAGLEELPGEPSYLRVSSPVYVTSEDEKKICAVLPSDRLSFTYVIEYGDNAIGTQAATVVPTKDNFVAELGQCRTFCLYEEVAHMRSLGLGLGGTVETALIVDGQRVLTPGGLRRPDEFVRHKILDMMGDLTLIGKPVIGHFIGIRAGHAMHQKLVGRIARECVSA